MRKVRSNRAALVWEPLMDSPIDSLLPSLNSSSLVMRVGSMPLALAATNSRSKLDPFTMWYLVVVW